MGITITKHVKSIWIDELISLDTSEKIINFFSEIQKSNPNDKILIDWKDAMKIINYYVDEPERISISVWRKTSEPIK